jgi:endoglucanase
VDPDTTASAAQRADLTAATMGVRAVDGGDPQTNALAIGTIARTSQARWLTSSTPASAVAGQVSSYLAAAASQRALPVLVLAAVPRLNCSSLAVEGLPNPADYRGWISQVATALESAPSGSAAVLLEPGALTATSCLTPAQLTDRLTLLRAAVTALTAVPRIGLYLDAGTSHSLPAATVASRLRTIGVAKARGFSLNVGDFYTTADEQAYGEALSGLLGGAHYVVDTSRNGNGPAPAGALSSCNPSGRALGPAPSTSTGQAHADALLWVKHPGESDGLCHPGDPAAGSWFESYAIGLVHGSTP